MTTLDTNGANAMRAPTDAEIFLYAHRGAVEWPAEHIKNMDLTMLAREVERLRALSSLPAQAVGDGDFTERLRETAYRDTAKSITVSAADLRAHLEATQRYVLNRLAPSQPAAVGERADALWEQLLPFMQVEECSPGDPYKDKVAALALIEAALVHRDQVKL